jgi:hypothetical protein
MAIMSRNNFWPYLSRFILVYLFTSAVVTFLFLAVQSAVPEESRIALDFFEPYKAAFSELPVQTLRAIVMALVLFPFYKLILGNRQGIWLLFAALWGLAIFGSMEPRPGSIEGMIYTHTSLFEHLLVMLFSAVQVLLFAGLFLKWERKAAAQRADGLACLPDREAEGGRFKREKGYYIRFTLLHIIVYIVVGSIFYQLAGYEEALASMEEFTLWRDLQTFGMAAAVFLGQIARGAFVALMVAPFYDHFMNRVNGWLLLFGLLFGLKVLIVLIVVPSLPFKWEELLIGLPEITVQTFLFSLLFYLWEKRRKNRIELAVAG